MKASYFTNFTGFISHVCVLTSHGCVRASLDPTFHAALLVGNLSSVQLVSEGSKV